MPFDTRFRSVPAWGGGGSDGKEIPSTERFFVGGINTMRGFAFGKAGPVVPDLYTIIGASKELIFNFDYIFTISSDAKLNGVIFFDYGKGFDDNETTLVEPEKGRRYRRSMDFAVRTAACGLRVEFGAKNRRANRGV